MTAQVHPFPEKLDRLTGKIKSDLERRAQSEADWVEATIDLCADLAAARAEFKDNKSFGEWFDASGFELSKDDRAAAIAMGEDIARTREVLTATDRRSLRLICDNEFRVRSAAKTRTPSNKVQKALDAYDRLNEAGEKPTKKAVQAEAGVGKSTVEDAFLIREVAVPKPAAPLPELSMTAQQKLEAWQRKLEADFEYRVRQASKQWLDEIRITIYEEKIEKLMRMLSYPQYAVMRKVEYNKILKCLHPDHIANRTVEELGEAFRIFTHYKLKMINDEEERADAMRKLRGNLPTREEMLARMKKPK